MVKIWVSPVFDLIPRQNISEEKSLLLESSLQRKKPAGFLLRNTTIPEQQPAPDVLLCFLATYTPCFLRWGRSASVGFATLTHDAFPPAAPGLGQGDVPRLSATALVMEKGWLSPCPEHYHPTPLNYSPFVAKGSPEVVTNLNLRLDGTKILGHIHPAAPKFRLKTVH